MHVSIPVAAKKLENTSFFGESLSIIICFLLQAGRPGRGWRGIFGVKIGARQKMIGQGTGDFGNPLHGLLKILFEAG